MKRSSRIARPNRRSVRAPAYDYSSPGTYFVTICVQDRTPALGAVEESSVKLTMAGRIVEAAWRDLPDRFSWIDLDAMVVMPNHVHGILMITVPDGNVVGERADYPDRGKVGAAGVMNHAPTRRREQPSDLAPVALGEVVRTFKAVATRSIRKSGYSEFRWQRNYHEHIIRSERSLERIRDYVAGNPGRWVEDRYFVEDGILA